MRIIRRFLTYLDNPLRLRRGDQLQGKGDHAERSSTRSPSQCEGCIRSSLVVGLVALLQPLFDEASGMLQIGEIFSRGFIDRQGGRKNVIAIAARTSSPVQIGMAIVLV